MAGILKELYYDEIVNNLFDYPGTEFITKGRDLSAFVSNNILNIPQAGAEPNVEKNRAIWPMSVTQRTDTNRPVQCAHYSVDAVVIQHDEEFWTAYDKMSSVLGDFVGTLNERIAQEVAYQWAAAGSTHIIRTTGATGGALVPGNLTPKKKITAADLRTLAAAFDADKIGKNDRYLVMPSALYWELMAETVVSSSDFIMNKPTPDGIINKLYGFNIMTSELLPYYDNQSTPVKKAVGSAGAAGDNYACIAFHRSSVCYAKGDILTFEELNSPTWQGDVYSGRVYLASDMFRDDHKGIKAIVQINA